MKDSDAAEPPILLRDRSRALRALQTEVERRIWQRLRNRQIKGAKFRRQHPLGPYIVDFVCIDAQLIIELDGGQHGEERELQSDRHRADYLEGVNYRVLRFWNQEVIDNIEGVIEQIANFL